ncbi:glycoside hydrolase family 88/105 protein [Coraliomargarita akajimensis]|uniref:Glycosyl hydrolase family 88 n=1 Tax=Coraliomargarita akajimensis (strain DSM 45221 / IAM 15411 / JCM 23193 / KCTC 12865 / 04OKA010-24) TaxID=583355 RepID=D5EQ67_CORAD|nr:glycoside hydrolase family 88 protein [Coraliomargarita akajimensis]ADE53835.1 glycosyl hydrolase family 88 [Coraliomargarita akajimensis DSM 45221]
MIIRKLVSLGGALLLGGSAFAAKEAPDLAHFEVESIQSIMHRVNNYALENPMQEWDRNWIRATWYSGVTEAYHATGEQAYLDQAEAWGKRHEFGIGFEHSGFNRLFCSMTWLELYLLNPDPAKIAPTIAGLELEDKPFIPKIGEIWYGHEPHMTDPGWVYADGLYSSTAFVMLYKATGEQKYLDFLHDAFWSVTDKILDTDDNLYYRDPNYIGRKSPHGGKILWSRGNGWVFAGLPRVLKHLPKDDPYYDRYLDLYKRMAKALAARQQDDGFWRSNLGDAQHYTMPESSGTAFFLAGFGWGVQEGHLDAETYVPVMIRAWDALVSSVHPSGLLGWVQPVDAAPRPSHPQTTQEYGAGLFLSAASQMYQLVKSGAITETEILAALPAQSQLLPPVATRKAALTRAAHPLYAQINAFQQNQSAQAIEPTQLSKQDYLDVIAGQIRTMAQYQDAKGHIIDPVENHEKYYATPCYAHSVAVLAKAGYPIGDEIIESGMKALDASLASIGENTARDHSDFFTWPVVLAYNIFSEMATDDRAAKWTQLLEQVDHTKYHFYKEPIPSTEHMEFYKHYNGHFSNNWNLVHVAGEWARTEHGFGDPWYVDYCLTMQLPSFTEYGMYTEWGNPLAYDAFARHYINGMFAEGYDSFLHTTYRDILWRGAWSSLFMQSPNGEQPTGHRSSHHIWNEAEQAVIFEIYATAYAEAGLKAEAGAFKRAANLSLQSVKQWIRPDGTGYVVKNRYPIEAKHGYERYTVHTTYNLLACSMLAQAWTFATDGIEEQASPADVGGYVAPIIGHFRKVFANAGGNYVEYDVKGDQKYNPTGLIRVHLKDGHPQLGPSDGTAEIYGGEGVSLSTGPIWKTGDSRWLRLAAYKVNPKVSIVESSADKVTFKVTYPEASQTITVDPSGVTVKDEIAAKSADRFGVRFPALVFDGMERSEIALNGNQASVRLDGRGVEFSVVEPTGLELKRSGKEVAHRNGLVEVISAETDQRTLVYTIRAAK